MIGLPSPIALRTPGVMTGCELAAWAQIGKNAVPQLVNRFGIRELTGNAKSRRYPVHSVLRAILGVTPRASGDLAKLLIPLQKSSWVSRVTGLSVSAISAAACENRIALPLPIELTTTGPDQSAPRGRRWLPAQIEAHLYGDPIPFLELQIALQKTPPKGASSPARNVFAAICTDNDEVSR